MSDATFEQRIAQHRQVDAKIAEMEAWFKTKVQPYKDLRLKLRATMLDMLNKSGQDSAKTAAGTVYKNRLVSVGLEDADEFKRHVIGTESWDLLDWKANKTAVQDFIDANNALPPGVKMSTMVDVGVRAPTSPRKARKAGEQPDSPEAEDVGEEAEVSA